MLEPLRTLFCFLCSNTPAYTLTLARWKNNCSWTPVMSSPSQHASHFLNLCVLFIYCHVLLFLFWSFPCPCPVMLFCFLNLIAVSTLSFHSTFAKSFCVCTRRASFFYVYVPCSLLLVLLPVFVSRMVLWFPICGLSMFHVVYLCSVSRFGLQRLFLVCFSEIHAKIVKWFWVLFVVKSFLSLKRSL